MGTMKEGATFGSENPGYAYAVQTADLQHCGRLTDWLMSAMMSVNNEAVQDSHLRRTVAEALIGDRV